MNEGMSPADVAAVVDNNRSYGYGYPVMPMYGGYGYGNGGFGDGSWIWIILILALFGGFGGNGNGFGGFNNDYAWLSNGQKDIMTNTNNGFNSLHLADQVEGVKDGIFSLSNQLCNSTADVTSAINNGFYGAEISANNRAVNQMQDTWALSRQLSDCCCENRLATQDLKATVISENCADREALSNGIRDIITNQTANTQRVLDQLCQDKIDAKNEKIDDLQRKILMKDLQASQIAQTAQLRAGQEAEVDALYNRLSNCPVPTTPVYGRTPIFTCNGGCGCGNTFGNTIV